MARILVIDDDRPLRGAFRVVLEAAGYDVIDAADGEAGLRLHSEHGADLVIVDIFMPRRDGLEVIRALRAVIPRPKIIAISGGGDSGHTDILMTAAALGAASTLHKPFEPHELLAVIRELLRERSGS